MNRRNLLGGLLGLVGFAFGAAFGAKAKVAAPAIAAPLVADKCTITPTGKRWLEYHGIRFEIPDDVLTVRAEVVEYPYELASEIRIYVTHAVKPEIQK